MAQTSSARDIVPFIRGIHGAAITATAEAHRVRVIIHDESPTEANLEERRRAFTNLQELHIQIKFDIHAEIRKHVETECGEHGNVTVEEVFWAVLNGQGGPASQSTSSGEIADPEKIRSPLPVGSEYQNFDLPLNYQCCPYKGCSFSTQKGGKGDWELRRHVDTVHNKIRYPCGAGCNKDFSQPHSRKAHEQKVHGVVVTRFSQKDGGFRVSKQ
jgi:hypothetical protein